MGIRTQNPMKYPGCSGEQEATKSSQPANAAVKALAASSMMEQNHGETNYYLMFFLDPNGGPCRMQDSILSDMAEELKGKVNIRYVQTTVKKDLDLFYTFGVRGLPTLLLADSTGKEIKRMPPGIKNASDIRNLIKDIIPAG